MRECQKCNACYEDTIEFCLSDGMPTTKTFVGSAVLGKYHLKNRISNGGMGVVYEARHKELKTKHAVKIISPDIDVNPQILVRFQQEAIAAAAVVHPNIVSTTDYGLVNDGFPFLVMDFVKGRSLRDLLEEKGRFSPREVLELFEPIVAGVSAIHAKGIVHRDLKSLNIMIEDGKNTIAEALKILDFGLAKIKSPELLKSFIQAKTNYFMGSINYISPQQFDGEEADALDDIYSLGILIRELLTGKLVGWEHLTQSLPTFAALGLDIPPQIEKVITHAIEKDRTDRTPTVLQLLEELRSAVEESEAEAKTDVTLKFDLSKESSLRILTNPADANIFIDNVEVGRTRADGGLLLGGEWNGSYKVKARFSGYYDFEQEIRCYGEPYELAIKLTPRDESVELADSIPFNPPFEQEMPFSGYRFNSDNNEDASAPLPDIYGWPNSFYSQTEFVSPELPDQSVKNHLVAPQAERAIPLSAILGVLTLIAVFFPGLLWLVLDGLKTDFPKIPSETVESPVRKDFPPIEQMSAPAVELEKVSDIDEIPEPRKPVIKQVPQTKKRYFKPLGKRSKPSFATKDFDCIYDNSCG